MKLFQPDNFTSSEIVYRLLSLEERKPLLAVLGQYGFPSDAQCSQLVGTEINSQNYQVQFFVDGRPEVVLVRRSKYIHEASELKIHLDLLRLLKDMGVAVPEIRASRQGEDFIEVSGEFYIAFSFIEGSHFIATVESYKSFASHLAKLHLSLAQLPKDIQKDLVAFNERNGMAYYHVVKKVTSDDIENICIALGEDDNEIANFIKSESEFLKGIADLISSHAFELSKFPQQIIHSDIHPHNVLYKGVELKAFIDFDAARLSERIRDVCMGVYRFGRQLLVNANLDGSIKTKAQELSAVFLNEYQSVSPLTQEEVQLLPIVLYDEFLRKLMFVLKNMVQKKNIAWSPDVLKFFTALKEIPYFFNI